MRKAFCGVVVGLFALFSLAASKAVAQGDAKAGKQVYDEQRCAGCHGEGGKGDGPKRKQQDKMADWTKKDDMDQLTDEYLEKIIAEGGKAVKKSTRMPKYKKLKEEDKIKDLVAFIRSLASSSPTQSHKPEPPSASSSPHPSLRHQ
jgi:mono/diheme cytochrome c family protein